MQKLFKQKITLGYFTRQVACLLVALIGIGNTVMPATHAFATGHATTATTINNSADNPSLLNPVPLRELYTQPNQMYLYSAYWPEVAAAQTTNGLKLSSQRPIGYVFAGSTADTTPLYRLQQKATGNWLVTSSASEESALVNNGTFVLQGTIGNIYTSAQYGAQPLNRYTNGKGWRLAYQSQNSAMQNAGYTLDGLVGYMLPTYYQIGAYYFGAYDQNTNADLLQAVQNVYARYPDAWGGVRDFHGDPTSPWGAVAQNTQGWSGDFSYLKPSQGYYDDSKVSTLETQIDQAANAGLSYFAFYSYWNNATGTIQYNQAINSFMAASNSSRMKFMVTPCLASNAPSQHLSVLTSQFQAAATAFASYTSQPNYLTTQDGRPIIFLCDVRGIGSGSATDVNNFVSLLQQAVKAKTGQNPYILEHSDYGLPTASQYTGDGYTCLNMYGYVSAGSYSNYVSNMGSYFSTFDNSGKPMMRCAMSGFNEAPRTNLVMTKDQVLYFKDNTKNQFPAAMAATLKNMKAQPASPIDNYMTIYAWNEWHEGGIIEPNVRDGNYYLQNIQNTFGLPSH